VCIYTSKTGVIGCRSLGMEASEPEKIFHIPYGERR